MRPPRILAVALATFMLMAAGLEPARANSGRANRDGLAGVWTGTWSSPDGVQRGVVEMIITEAAARPAVVAQVTFVDGGLADTVRREGRYTSRGLYFELVGGGTLVLELESGRLIGEFAGGPDVPARYGLLDLTRKS
jgi:hypothetical protein